MDNRTYKQVCQDLALEVSDLGDGPDHPAFQRDYADNFNCLEVAFHDGAAVFVDELTGDKADELHRALVAFETAKAGGSIEARDLAARTVAGLVSAHAVRAGGAILEKYQSDAWDCAAIDAAQDAYSERMAADGRVW